MKIKDTGMDVSVVAELTLTYNPTQSIVTLPHVTGVDDAIDYLRKIWPESIGWRECFVALMLNQQNRILGHAVIGVGAINYTMVDARVIMQIALLSNAVGILIAHNHPSGLKEPSQQDIDVTRDVGKMCEIHHIALQDHVIITPDSGFSFAESRWSYALRGKDRFDD